MLLGFNMPNNGLRYLISYKFKWNLLLTYAGKKIYYMYISYILV